MGKATISKTSAYNGKEKTRYEACQFDENAEAITMKIAALYGVPPLSWTYPNFFYTERVKGIFINLMNFDY